MLATNLWRASFQALPSEDNEAGNTVLYALDDGSLDELNDFDRQWEEFLSSICNQSRFFNRHAKKFLDDLFQVLSNGDDLDQSVINSFNYDVPVYRARVAPDKRTLKDIQTSPRLSTGANTKLFCIKPTNEPRRYFGVLWRTRSRNLHQ